MADPQLLELVVHQFVDVVGFGASFQVNSRPLGRTMNCVPTVCVSKRAIMKASPRFSAVTTPSWETGAELSLFELN
jgi:hypothetical protein